MKDEYTVEYLTAEQARICMAESQSLSGAYMKEETEGILAFIKEAAQKGRGEIDVSYTDAIVASRLKFLGYGVTINRDPRDGDFMNITWYTK